MLSRQCKLVLDHITSKGYITPLVAGNYGVTRLASRVYDLKKAGYPIAKSHAEGSQRQAVHPLQHRLLIVRPVPA